jgi:hypothetical protein
MTTDGRTAPGALPVTAGTTLDLEPIVGTWHATDQHTPGVTRLELTGTDGVLVISARGADEPQPRDWGEAEATSYGADPGSDKAMAFTAEYEFGFLTILLAAYAKQGILVLDTFTSFRDGSGRSDYFTREFFHR